MARLDGKVAIVTGAGQGIGRGIARRFAREGARILIAEYNDETGARTAKEVSELGSQARFVHTDVGVKEEVDACVAAALDTWGRVDILVNNAWAGPPMGRVEWKTTAELEQSFRVGTLSNFWSMQAVFPHMKAQRWGRIVNLCSLNGVNAHMYTVHYNAAKEAVRALTRTAAREWARHGICCNALCPAAATEADARSRLDSAGSIASTRPNAAATPIAGAPRTARRRIAAATSSGRRQWSHSSRAGSAVWSRRRRSPSAQRMGEKISSLAARMKDDDSTALCAGGAIEPVSRERATGGAGRVARRC